MTVPAAFGGIFEDAGGLEKNRLDVDRFTKSARKMHVFGKAIVITAALMCEALVNTLIRVAALPRLREDPEVLLEPLLHRNLGTKLKVIHAYTIAFSQALDCSSPVVLDVLKLMGLRNHFVHAGHAQETALPDIYFDGYFPLYGNGDGAIVESVQRRFLKPSPDDVAWALKVSLAFDEYVRGRLDPRLKSEIEQMLKSAQISFNTSKKIYSEPFASKSTQFVITGASDKE